MKKNNIILMGGVIGVLIGFFGYDLLPTRKVTETVTKIIPEEIDKTLSFQVSVDRQKLFIYYGNEVQLELPISTGSNGIGNGHAQTPLGSYELGGVRVADNPYIQTGDTKRGVSGVYAEILYPEGHKKRGEVLNNGIIIHSYNPEASSMLKERYRQKKVGRVPCSLGCVIIRLEDIQKIAPFLIEGSGPFANDSRPNKTLTNYINRGIVKEYEKERGAQIWITK